MTKVLKMKNNASDEVISEDKIRKRKALEKSNKEAERKINHYTQVIGLLEIRMKHYDSLAKLKFIPMFLRAKYRLKALEIDSDIIAKRHFVTIYNERLVNVDYAEMVLEPKEK